MTIAAHGLALSHGPFVYRSNGNSTFTDVRNIAHLTQAPSYDSKDWHGHAVGDYDGDGNLDIYIAEGAKGSSGGTDKRDPLFRGNGDGTFTYASDTAGLIISQHRGRCSLWLDYDNDGLLDLFVKNYGDINDLYRNLGQGNLSIVPDAAGLAYATSGTDFGSIMAMADYDNDGYMDIAMTGDGDVQALYRNVGGTFVDVTEASKIAPGSDGKGLAWGDYDNDGYVDLFVTRGQLGGPSSGGNLYHNNGDGTFTDTTTAAGMQDSGNCWSAVWGDYDNDGYLDLFVTVPGTRGNGPGNANLLYHNNHNGTFTDVALAQGVALNDGLTLHKTAAWADYDNDGFLDLLIKNGIGSETDIGDAADGTHVLLRNTPNGNHFVKVNLKGVQSNLNGIGARLSVTTPDGLTCYRQNTGDSGGNYASQGNVPVHFGIGAAATADLTIIWPSRITQTLSNVAANSTLTVVEASGDPTPTPTPTPTATPTPTPAPPVITHQPGNRRVTVGRTARFTVAATANAPLSYQWRKNGIEIPGATAAAYITPPATLADNGAIFSVVVSDAAGSVTSRGARLTVSATATSDSDDSPH